MSSSNLPSVVGAYAGSVVGGALGHFTEVGAAGAKLVVEAASLGVVVTPRLATFFGFAVGGWVGTVLSDVAMDGPVAGGVRGAVLGVCKGTIAGVSGVVGFVLFSELLALDPLPAILVSPLLGLGVALALDLPC